MKRFITQALDKPFIRVLLAAAVWLIVWELVYLAAGSELLFVSPSATLKTLFSLASTGAFWASVGMSLLRIAAGFCAGSLLGVLFAALCAVSRLADTVLSPALKLVRATPVVSFIILAWVWMARGFIPVFITMLMVMPIVWESVLSGIRRVPAAYLEFASLYRLSAPKKLFSLYLPSVLPDFASGAVTALGLAWKSGVAAEVICQPAFAVGTGLYNAKIYLETGEIFAWTTVVVVLSVLLEKILRSAVHRLGRRRADG